MSLAKRPLGRRGLRLEVCYLVDFPTEQVGGGAEEGRGRREEGGGRRK